MFEKIQQRLLVRRCIYGKPNDWETRAIRKAQFMEYTEKTIAWSLIAHRAWKYGANYRDHEWLRDRCESCLNECFGWTSAMWSKEENK